MTKLVLNFRPKSTFKWFIQRCKFKLALILWKKLGQYYQQHRHRHHRCCRAPRVAGNQRPRPRNKGARVRQSDVLAHHLRARCDDDDDDRSRLNDKQLLFYRRAGRVFVGTRAFLTQVPDMRRGRLLEP